MPDPLQRAVQRCACQSNKTNDLKSVVTATMYRPSGDQRGDHLPRESRRMVSAPLVRSSRWMSISVSGFVLTPFAEYEMFAIGGPGGNTLIESIIRLDCLGCANRRADDKYAVRFARRPAHECDSSAVWRPMRLIRFERRLGRLPRFGAVAAADPQSILRKPPIGRLAAIVGESHIYGGDTFPKGHEFAVFGIESREFAIEVRSQGKYCGGVSSEGHAIEAHGTIRQTHRLPTPQRGILAKNPQVEVGVADSILGVDEVAGVSRPATIFDSTVLC